MPELPEVETVRRGLEPAMLDKRITKITLNRPDLRVPITPGFEDKLEGATLTQLIRRGKYIIALADNDYGFVLHLGMSGRVAIHADKNDYTPAKHDHVLFHIEDGGLIVLNDPRRFGMLYLVEAQNWDKEPPFSEMGPEPLSNHFSADALYERLHKKGTPIKNALLDQKVVSGVGNIYACEALFDSHIHPETQSFALQHDDIERLVPAIRDVLIRAINSGGSSLRDYKQTDGSLGYFQHSFSVYDREGAPCPNCDESKNCVVERIVQSNRSTFFCPACQKKKRIQKKR
ncbi:MAG: bifunctional DNA-formamidopyrimidine glycosylase/DNA-(apurinic or apyrimidinic site) lyase [Pseudomonadota bacterium]